MAEIVYPLVEKYLRSLLAEPPGNLAEIEKKALAEQVPIVLPEVARLLTILAGVKGARRILEIGTAVGYSTLWLAYGTGDDSLITTIDWNLDRAAEAEANFRQAGLDHRIRLLKGDAREILPNLGESFDLIFLDAMKNHYPELLPRILARLEPGGLLIADNVLFRGLVARADVPEKYQTGVGNLRKFLNRLMNCPDMETVLLPVGDGVSLSHKKR